MSGNFAIKGGGGGVGPLMANSILNFHFDFLHTSLSKNLSLKKKYWWGNQFATHARISYSVKFKNDSCTKNKWSLFSKLLQYLRCFLKKKIMPPWKNVRECRPQQSRQVKTLDSVDTNYFNPKYCWCNFMFKQDIICSRFWRPRQARYTSLCFFFERLHLKKAEAQKQIKQSRAQSSTGASFFHRMVNYYQRPFLRFWLLFQL